MAERNRVPNDVLSDSEAALRMMDAILEELQGGKDRDDAALDYAVGPGDAAVRGVTVRLSDLAALVMQFYLDVIETTRDPAAHAVGPSRRATVEQVQATQQSCGRSPPRPELAATDMPRWAGPGDREWSIVWTRWRPSVRTMRNRRTCARSCARSSIA